MLSGFDTARRVFCEQEEIQAASPTDCTYVIISAIGYNNNTPIRAYSMSYLISSRTSNPWMDGCSTWEFLELYTFRFPQVYFRNSSVVSFFQAQINNIFSLVKGPTWELTYKSNSKRLWFSSSFCCQGRVANSCMYLMKGLSLPSQYDFPDGIDARLVVNYRLNLCFCFALPTHVLLY